MHLGHSDFPAQRDYHDISDGLQPNSNGLQPKSDGGHLTSDGFQPIRKSRSVMVNARCYGMSLFKTCRANPCCAVCQVILLRFGCDYDPDCKLMDEILLAISDKVKVRH